jgi:hypothetical protein
VGVDELQSAMREFVKVNDAISVLVKISKAFFKLLLGDFFAQISEDSRQLGHVQALSFLKIILSEEWQQSDL